jgi:pimeloyl-ACP methyl ester carboxylesterase
MGFVTTGRAVFGVLVLMCAATLQANAKASNAHQRGAAPTAAMLEAPLGELLVAEAVVTRDQAHGFGGGTIYYPATPGQYAAIVVVPGYTGYQSSLAWLGPKLASHGFVVMVIDTFTTGDPPDHRAKQASAALQQVKELNANKRSPMYKKVDTKRLAIMGHSMGGGAALIAARENPQLKAALAYTVWSTDRKFDTMSVPTMLIACERDVIAPNGVHGNPIYDSLPGGMHKAYVEIKGQTHFCPQLPGNYPLMGRYTIAWMKRFLDDDARYSPFICGAEHQAIASGDKFSAHRSSCPF